MKLAQKLVIEYFRASLNLRAVISPNWAAKKAFVLFTSPRNRSRHPLPDIFKKGERISFNHNGNLIRGYRWNKGGVKRLLVLHGYESTCRKFDHHISRSIRLGYEVLAFDAPAHGESEGRSVHALMYADMIRQAIMQFGKVNTFICHSFGGIALSLYLETVEHDEHTKVAFIAPATETTSAINGFFHFLQLGGHIRKAFDQRIKNISGQYPEHFSIKRAMTNIKARILWIHDENDQVTPIDDVQPLFDQALPNIEFMITKGLGHNRIYRDNAVKKRLFSFISFDHTDALS